MRVDEIAVGIEDLLDGGKAGLVVDGVGRKLAAHRSKSVGIHAEALLLAQIGHPAANRLSVASGKLEQLALQVGGHQDVHRRRRRQCEVALGDVVGAGVDEVGEHAVLVARAEEHLDRGAHALGVPCGEDVSEIARGDADVDRLAGFDLALRNQLGVARDVIHDLGHKPSPVDGVRAR